MTNELQPQLKLLAEKAGVKITPLGTGFYEGICHHDNRDEHYHDVSIGMNGTLSGTECWTVQGWLAKLGDKSHGGHVKIEFQTGGYWITLDGFTCFRMIAQKAATPQRSPRSRCAGVALG